MGGDPVGPDGDAPATDSMTRRLDYEGELAVVLAKDGKNIKPAEARDYVWGVTLLCDWSIRDLHEPDGPYKFAKARTSIPRIRWPMHRGRRGGPG